MPDIGWACLGGCKLPTEPQSAYMSHPPYFKGCPEEILFMAMAEEQESPHNQARTFQLLLIKLTDILLATADPMAKPRLKGW